MNGRKNVQQKKMVFLMRKAADMSEHQILLRNTESAANTRSFSGLKLIGGYVNGVLQYTEICAAKHPSSGILTAGKQLCRITWNKLFIVELN